MRRKYVTALVGQKGEQAGKDFFSEEKKQKTFISCVQQPIQIGESDATRNREKFFASFFQKRSLTFSLHPDRLLELLQKDPMRLGLCGSYFDA